MSVELRRVIVDPSWDEPLVKVAGALNRVIARDRGDSGGRVWLLGDDGERNEILGGDLIDSGNYPLWARSAAGNHGRFEHSAETHDVFLIQDAGITVRGTVGITGATTIVGNTAITGTFGVTGTSTLTGTLTVSGATTLQSTLAVTGDTTLTGALTANGAVTLGDAAADVITVKGTPTFNENVVMVKNLTVDTTTFVVDAVNNKVGVGAVPASTDAMFQVAGIMASTGLAGSPTTNVNLVYLFYSTTVGAGIIRAINPGTSTWLPMIVDGLSTDIRASNVSKIKVDATGIGLHGATPVAQQSVAAAATDLASVITLANSIRTNLRTRGDFS